MPVDDLGQMPSIPSTILLFHIALQLTTFHTYNHSREDTLFQPVRDYFQGLVPFMNAT
jgi:hypothetical protein